MLGHHGQYDQARAILEDIRSSIDGRSEIERMYAIKEQAVATAHSGDLKRTRELFEEAAEAAEDVHEDVGSIRAHALALRVEAAICTWRLGDHTKALPRDRSDRRSIERHRSRKRFSRADAAHEDEMVGRLALRNIKWAYGRAPSPGARRHMRIGRKLARHQTTSAAPNSRT